MAKVLHIYGLVRDAQVASKRGGGEVFGAKLNILSEPDGDTVVVTAFERTISPDDAVALKGRTVHAIVSCSARPAGTEVAYLDANLISVEPWAPSVPLAVAAPEPVPA